METTVKKLISKESGFLIHPNGGKDVYFHLEGGQTLPGQEPQLPQEGDAVVILKLTKDGKNPRARRWVLP